MATSQTLPFWWDDVSDFHTLEHLVFRPLNSNDADIFSFYCFKVSRPLNLVVSHSPISTGATPVPAITVQKTPKKELEAGEKEDQSSSKQINTDSQSHIQAASGSTESSGYGACLPTESATNSSIIVDDDMNGACSSSKRR
ncbi:uncharacterized protein LOC144648611 [Oculina patagonica]